MKSRQKIPETVCQNHWVLSWGVHLPDQFVTGLFVLISPLKCFVQCVIIHLPSLNIQCYLPLVIHLTLSY